MKESELSLKQVLVIDDHAVLRDGINLLLNTLDSGVTVYEVSTAAEAFDQARQLTDIDLVLLDLALPDDPHGIHTLEKLCELLPAVPIIVLSANEKTSKVRESIQLGAKGYLPKSSSPQVIHNAIRLVLAGGIYIPPTTLDLTGEMDNRMDTGASSDSSNDLKINELHDRLTSRHIEILKLIAQGKTNNEISESLGMSAATVRTHLTVIFKRLGVKNRTEAGHVAHKFGLELEF